MDHKQHDPPNQYSASAPIEFPIPPPAYSECEPSYPQNQQPLYSQQHEKTFSQNQQTPFTYSTQQPQVQHVVVLQIPQIMEHKRGPPDPLLHTASAPTEMDFPTPPPAYSECEPSYPQNQHQHTFPQNQQHHTFPQNQFLVQQPQVHHVIVSQILLAEHPINTSCPSCHATIVTKVKSEANISTHLVALVLCMLCPFCSCLPYCMQSCQSTVHSCPGCGAFIGSNGPRNR